jgi:hypothetical protein
MEPNMSPAAIDRWTETKAYAQYRRYRDNQKYRGYTAKVVTRARRVAAGKASEGEREKVSRYLKRAIKNGSGEKRFGFGATAVSANTAALRNWGFDPTGRFT